MKKYMQICIRSSLKLGLNLWKWTEKQGEIRLGSSKLQSIEG